MASTTGSTQERWNMKIKPIRSAKDHREALKDIERLWTAKEGTPEDDRLEVLLTLVDAYEEAHFPIDVPDPIDAIKFRLEQQSMTPKALIGVIGSRTRVYEVLRGSRSLSLAMIRRLHERLHIPAEVLIRPAKRRRMNRAA